MYFSFQLTNKIVAYLGLLSLWNVLKLLLLVWMLHPNSQGLAGDCIVKKMQLGCLSDTMKSSLQGDVCFSQDSCETWCDRLTVGLYKLVATSSTLNIYRCKRQHTHWLIVLLERIKVIIHSADFRNHFSHQHSHCIFAGNANVSGWVKYFIYMIWNIGC